MTELSEHAPEIWWEDGELVLCRSMPDGEPLAVLTAMPLTSPPSREAIGRLQHAYKLRDQLDPAWAARPLRLVTERGRLTLLSEDPGGEPLLRAAGAALGDRFVFALRHRPGSCASATPRARPHSQGY